MIIILSSQKTIPNILLMPPNLVMERILFNNRIIISQMSRIIRKARQKDKGRDIFTGISQIEVNNDSMGMAIKREQKTAIINPAKEIACRISPLNAPRIIPYKRKHRIIISR